MSKRSKPIAEVTIKKGTVERQYPLSYWQKNENILRQGGWSLVTKIESKPEQIKVEQTEISSPSNLSEDGTSLPN